jgi:hypothetical protein
MIMFLEKTQSVATSLWQRMDDNIDRTTIHLLVGIMSAKLLCCKRWVSTMTWLLRFEPHIVGLQWKRQDQVQFEFTNKCLAQEMNGLLSSYM